MWEYWTASILITSHNSGEDKGNKPYTLKSTHKGQIKTIHQLDVLMEHIRNNQAVFANILILSASENVLLTCLVHV